MLPLYFHPETRFFTWTKQEFFKNSWKVAGPRIDHCLDSGPFIAWFLLSFAENLGHPSLFPNSCIYKHISISWCCTMVRCAVLIYFILYYATLDCTTVTWYHHLPESLLTHKSRLISRAFTHSSTFWTVKTFGLTWFLSNFISWFIYTI